MALIGRFEDLIAWQKARALAVEVYRATEKGRIARDFAISDQLHRSGLSVPSNVSEGFERGSKAEFHRVLSIAKGSCAELRSHLYVAEDLGLLDSDVASHLRSNAEEVGRIIGGLRRKVGAQRVKPGVKRKR